MKNSPVLLIPALLYLLALSPMNASDTPDLPGYTVNIEEPEQRGEGAVLRCMFFQEVSPEVADRIVRAELTKAAPRFQGEMIHGFGYVKRGTDASEIDRLAMADGAMGLILDGKSGRIVTARENAAASAPAAKDGENLVVQCSISAQRVGGGGMQIHGETNLPDGTNIMITVLNGGQTKTEVRKGAFSGGPFTFRGQAYPSGKYDIRIVMPIATTQPSEVRAIIGDNGEKLAGPLVQVSDLGRVIRFASTVTLE